MNGAETQQETTNSQYFDTVIVGGGPAGTGLVLQQMKAGTLDKFFGRGVALIEAGDKLVVGELADYVINSDTPSNVFLECLEGKACDYFDVSYLQKEIDFIEKYKDRNILLDVWLVNVFAGKVRGRENQEIRWIVVDEVDSYQFPDADIPVINAIKNNAIA